MAEMDSFFSAPNLDEEESVIIPTVKEKKEISDARQCYLSCENPITLIRGNNRAVHTLYISALNAGLSQ